MEPPPSSAPTALTAQQHVVHLAELSRYPDSAGLEDEDGAHRVAPPAFLASPDLRPRCDPAGRSLVGARR